MIPLVLTGEVDMTLFIPPHSMINAAQFDSPQQLSDYLYYLLRNETAYKEYFAWRKDYAVTSYYR